MNLNRQRLVSILNVLSTCVGNKVMRVADYVCFRIDRPNNKLFISTTDFNAFITIDYGDLTLVDLGDVPDMFLVNFKLLHAIVRGSTTENVDFTSSKSGDLIHVRTNGSYDLAVWANTDEFPRANFSYTEVGRWPVPVLQTAWNKAVVAVSKDVTKINYQGVNYDGNFAASDNRRLSVAMSEERFDGDPILLMPTFGDIIKSCRNTVSIGPNDSRNMFIIVCEEIGLVASVRTLDAKFVDYKRLLETRGEGIKVTLPKQELIGAVSRLSIFTDQLYKVVNIRIKAVANQMPTIELSINNKNGGVEYITALGADGITEEGVVCDSSYHLGNLMDGILVTESNDNIQMLFESNGKLWIEEPNYKYLLTKIQN